ncbi:hypothetical protein HELRODRAFT_183145 [Helobdella robusta]|uniref:Reverse transcriptase domain-containing protein n=1 Tax=Helobdella robusta TaxID=6412 RepID=T1FJ73_HELRO|nr:hypothetical protein HELRODRAFT_183145 [Helobdella robusta]ESO11451.1 hypothetical protein HELRODRAFT_183145 [Helobdella robusta]
MERKDDPNTVSLNEVFDCFQLVNRINEPTHELGGVLDLIVTSRSFPIFNSLIFPSGVLSDHGLIQLVHSVNVNPTAIEDHSHRFSSFEVVTPAEIKNIIKSSCNKTSTLDPFPSRTTILDEMDLAAAFDIISHDILLRRLEVVFGVKGSVLSWLSPYLTGRSQFV